MEHLEPAQLAQLRVELATIAAASPRFVRLAENRIGRDFVIGDAHGAFDLVWRAMKLAGFDPTRDRLASVGDLVDRGEGSHRAGRFLAQPYVHAVRGNHEDDLVDLHLKSDDPDEILEVLTRINFNGMGWLAKLSALGRVELLKRFAALPYAIEVQTARGTVGILHGEVPRGMDWEEFVSGLEDREPTVLESCLRGRKRLKHGDTRGVPGIGRIFAGHTPQFGGAARLGNVYAIDTGAVFAEVADRPGAALTIANMAFQTSTLASPRSQGIVRLNDQVTDAPFGAYAEVEQASPQRG
ncbi:metallophosphoesterase [Variovorax sp. LjRoot290]|uniref:metallophosphoesterase n=1 Tax=unclassified Variovorax TaxID=663243 RepID=UPI003ECE4B1E